MWLNLLLSNDVLLMLLRLAKADVVKCWSSGDDLGVDDSADSLGSGGRHNVRLPHTSEISGSDCRLLCNFNSYADRLQGVRATIVEKAFFASLWCSVDLLSMMCCRAIFTDVPLMINFLGP